MYINAILLKMLASWTSSTDLVCLAIAELQAFVKFKIRACMVGTISSVLITNPDSPSSRWGVLI